MLNPTGKGTGESPVPSLVSRQRGFTLIELIITVVLIGVLSVVATSRFQNSSSFDTFALQGQVVAALRHIQFRAMQDTRADYCHRLVFDRATPAIGLPSNDYSATAQAALATCNTSIGADSPSYLTVTETQFNALGASLDAADGTDAVNWIEFDSFGRPQTAVGRCESGCEITLTAQSSSSVCVNREGYIRAC